MSKPRRRFFYFAHRYVLITLRQVVAGGREEWHGLAERHGWELANVQAASKDEALTAARDAIDQFYRVNDEENAEETVSHS